MKSTIKLILSFICHLLFIPSVLASIVGLTWYILPNFQTTQLGISVGDSIGRESMLLVTLLICGASILFIVLGKILAIIKNSKVLNFYTHIVTWLLTISLLGIVGYTFAVSDSMIATSFKLNAFRRAGIMICAVLMLLYSIIGSKLRKIIDRKIQAYQTAKELNANGRSSVIWVNILKTLDFVLPELITFILICFCFDLAIAKYFIIMGCSFIIPIIGNMICDKRVKKEAIRRENEKQEAQIHATAEAVADLMRQNGGNP